MTRYGMLINTKRCVGCFACRLACQMNNSLPAKDSYIGFKSFEKGTYPDVSTMEVPTQCVHCDNAPCVRVCPTGASHTTAEGVVIVDADRCVGCLYCMSACPYDVRIIDEKTGVSEKCRFCVFKEDGSTPSPACVSTCITGARVFGDIDDPESDISKAIIQYNAKSMSSSSASTKVFYPEETYELIKEPKADPILDLLDVAKPIAGAAAAATVVGLGVSYARGAGYKRDYTKYDPKTGETINLGATVNEPQTTTDESETSTEEPTKDGEEQR